MFEEAASTPRRAQEVRVLQGQYDSTHLRAILDSAVDFAIVAMDREGLISDWNVGAERVFGWPASAVLGGTGERFFTPEDRDAGVMAQEMRTALAHGRAHDNRWHLRQDGSRFWASGEMMPLRDVGGDHIGFLKILRDRTSERRAGEALKHVESALQASEEFSRRVLQSSPDCIKTLDLEGRLEFMSEGGLCVMEVDNFDAIRHAFWPDFWSGEGRAKVLAAIAEAKRGGVGRFEGPAPTAKGSPRWWDVVVTAIRDADGRPEKLLSVSRDVTLAKHGAIALRESEARLRFQTELDEKLLAVRDAAAAMRVAAEQLALHLGASRCAYADVDDDNDRFIIRNDFTAPGIATSAGTYSLDLFGPRAAAEMRTGKTLVVRDVSAELAPGEGREMFQAIGIDAIVCCPLNKDGRLVAMMAVHQDRPRGWRDDEIRLVEVTVARCWSHIERVGAEARLAESEERLRLATENAEVGSWDVDVVNDRLIWPPRVKAMFGISPDVPVTMQDFYDGLHPDDRVATSRAYEMASDPALRGLYDVEYRTVGKEDGIIRWVAAKGRGVFIADRCVRVIGTAVDITARKRIEARLLELNDTLELRVEEEVGRRAKAEEALRQSQKMEAVGQLTGGIAHDFNNLLAGISGSLDLMATRLSQGRLGELDRYMVAAQGAAKRAAALTHRLLAFSRRQTLDPKPTDVNRLVSDMEELIRRTVGPSASIEVVAAVGLWPALIDAGQLENTLLNLCINARDAMPDGGRITIETANRWLDERAAAQRELAPGQYLSLCVTDTGTGMTPEVIEKAFDPFFTTKPTGQGTGLGLSMVYGFARQSGGQVRIYSEVGQGTTVCLYLPRHYGDGVAADEPEAAAPPRAEQGETVLVVDDEPTVRMLVTEVLEELGYTAIEAADGPAGLRVLQSDVRIDLLVTDVGLPGGMNGRQMADAGRAVRPALKVLFITGYAENAAVGNGHLAPGMRVLTKPFAMDVLAARIREMIEMS